MTPTLACPKASAIPTARSRLAVAAAAACLGFLWQWATVSRNYGGDWTALFCVGGATRLPPEIRAFRFEGSAGFDGQFYYVIAHDPWMRKGLSRYVDEPGLRYRRILLPALAYALALGQPGLIAYAYILTNLAFLFLGVWWAAGYCREQPATGFLFLLIPPVLISLDRQTVDLAFAALYTGAIYFWRASRPVQMSVLLLLACLVRETGLIVVAGFILASLFNRDWRGATCALWSTLPFWLWSWHVGSRFPLGLGEWLPVRPYAWTVHALLHPTRLQFGPAITRMVWLVDLVSVAGFLFGCYLSLHALHAARWRSPAMWTSCGFAALGIYLFALDDWTHVYDYGRVSSPMAASLVLEYPSRSLRYLLPASLMLLRVVVQLAPQFLHVMGVPQTWI